MDELEKWPVQRSQHLAKSKGVLNKETKGWRSGRREGGGCECSEVKGDDGC